MRLCKGPKLWGIDQNEFKGLVGCVAGCHTLGFPEIRVKPIAALVLFGGFLLTNNFLIVLFVNKGIQNPKTREFKNRGLPLGKP